jgi:hypothetical protein
MRVQGPRREVHHLAFIREALADLAAGRKVATPASRPFGCTIAYRG